MWVRARAGVCDERGVGTCWRAPRRTDAALLLCVCNPASLVLPVEAPAAGGSRPHQSFIASIAT